MKDVCERFLMTLLLAMACIITQAQINVTQNGTVGNLSGISMITPQKTSSLTIVAEEITVQLHNGVEVFLNVRNVEYNIKKNTKDIRIKRKIIQTKYDKKKHWLEKVGAF